MRNLNMAGNMRKAVLLAAACLVLGMPGQALPAQEQAPLTYDYDELTVGNTTAFDGHFFTDMWGNATSDIDVRTLIHGYDLIRWDHVNNLFSIDPSVVSGVAVTENKEGDHTYTLTIYDDLYYNDGTKITAKDYAFSMLLGIAPQMAGIGANTKDAQYIAGSRSYVNGETSCLAGVRLLGDYTLSITLDHSYLPFFYEQSLLECIPYPISVIAPGCVVKDDGNGVYIANEDEEIREPLFTSELLAKTVLDPQSGYLLHPSVTCGPYVLTSFDGSTATFEINRYFKGNADGRRPSISKLVYTTSDNDTMIDELAGGSYGLLNKCVNMDALAAGVKLVTDSQNQFAMSSYARTGLSYISFCCEKDTVGSEAVRRAIAHCLDKDQLVEDYVGRFGLRVDGYYGIGQWMYQVLNKTMPYPLENPAEGDTGSEAKYEADLKAWEALSLDEVQVYDLDTDAATDLLISDGWVLDREGGEFDPEEDDVRCKRIGDELVALDLTLLYPDGNRISESLDENFREHLKKAGIALTIEAMPLDDLLDIYYRRNGQKRSCDMIYLATNFDIDFDPSLTFRAEPGQDGEEIMIDVNNVTGIADQQLYDLAVAMRRTEPGNLLEYCQKWVAFEKRFAQVMPMIPVYSNVYFDFYPTVLRNYRITEHVSWGEAIVEAYLSDPADEAGENMTEED